MKIKESRKASFAAMFFIYLFISAVGVVTFHFLPFGIYLNLFIADVIATVAIFIISVLLKNASVYDPYWSMQPIIISFLLATVKGIGLPALFLLIAIGIWGVRLTANWAYTFKGLLYEDWRYVLLKEKTGVWYPLINFIGIHMIPTVVVYLCVLPAVFVIQESPTFNAVAIIFFILSIFAVILQGVSDIEMHVYRQNRTEPFMRRGLWKYSRHPNYLGEILMWWGVGFYAFVLLPDKWYLLSGAVANTLLFIFVSIPMADKRQAKKEGFAEYKKETFALLPLPKLIRK